MRQHALAAQSRFLEAHLLFNEIFPVVCFVLVFWATFARTCTDTFLLQFTSTQMHG